MAKTISKKEYEKLKKKYDNYHEALKAMWEITKRYGNVSPEDRERFNLPPSPTNTEISNIEVYEFVHDPPVNYFSYIHEGCDCGCKNTLHFSRKMTTWTGQELGTVLFGQPYRSNFGDQRIPIEVKAINGLRYHGTFFQSAGDYCRIQQYKNQ